MQKSCEGVTNHLDSSARTKVLRLLSWHFIVLEIVACRSSFLCACTHALHYIGIVFFGIFSMVNPSWALYRPAVSFCIFYCSMFRIHLPHFIVWMLFTQLGIV